MTGAHIDLAAFIADTLANVGRSTGSEARALAAEAAEAAARAAVVDITHMNGFVNADEITVGGIVTALVGSANGFHNRYGDFRVVKTNRASVVVDWDGTDVRIPTRRVVRFRAA